MRASFHAQSDDVTRAGPSSIVRVAAALALFVPLAGCGTTDRLKPSSIASDDFEIRHPILLANDTTSIDIFPAGSAGRLDRHSAKQVVTFAEEYRQGGQGPIVILFPRGAGLGDQRQTIADIEAVVARVGARTRFDVSTYPAANPSLASPIRLSFKGLKARVGDSCGQWPEDVGSASSIEGWQNRQYYNFGCSVQTMVAAQTADPRDLVTPRGEEPADTQIRSRAIESIRKGTDPSTTWSIHNTTIATVGGS